MRRPDLKITILLLGLMLCFTSGAWAKTMCPLDSLKPKKVASLEALKRIPVLNQGRIKPFETYARNFLLQISGRGSYKKENASEWMARFLFAPRTTYGDKVFLINHPEILEALRIPPEKSRRYSYSQLNVGHDKLRELAESIQKIDPKRQTIIDKEIVRVYSNLVLFGRLSGAFTFAVPHPDFTFASQETNKLLGLSPDQTQISFYDVFIKIQTLMPLAKTLNQKMQDQWTKQDEDLAKIFGAMSFWERHYSNCPLGLIPTASAQDEEWISPMDTLLVGLLNPVYMDEVRQIRNAAVSYWNGEQLQFDTALRAFSDSIEKRVSAREKKGIEKISLEVLYNRLSGIGWAKFLYGLGLMLVLISLMGERPWMRPLTLVLTLAGFFPHVLSLVLRCIILSRPPVSNLFETFIFVGVICVFLGLWLEFAHKNWLGLAVATIGGLIMLLISGRYSSEGDTMQMLVAVLDSNFWLSTHVITITIGYAGCCVAGIMGHIYILQSLKNHKDQKVLDVTFQNMLGILGFGLTMSFLGTALGGIWADQSWGRFWGWDPKENGALMIVLWSAIVFHAKIAKVINPLGVAVGCILTLMVVMWAWFGVNLLSVGLHSYGFTSGIATSLMLYAIAEIVFISVTVILLGRKNVKF